MSVTAPCREGVTSQTISAWTDGGLSATETARLEAHIATCASCQETRDAYRELDALLRAQRIPAAPPADVAAIRATRPGARNARGTRLPRAVWSGIGAAVAAALLIAAFSQVFARLGHLTPTATATPNLTPTPHYAGLLWSPRPLPPGVSLQQNGADFAFSPASSQDAWACALRPDGKITIWVTTDQAHTWKVVDTLTPPATPTPITSCSLTTDSVSPKVIGLNLSWGCGECGTSRATGIISGDGGVSWSALPSGDTMQSLATLGPRTFAIIAPMTTAGRTPTPLLVSEDGLRTWRVAAPGEVEAGVSTMWADSVSAVLYAISGETLWRTNNGGATWTGFPFSRNVQVTNAIWLPAARHARICGQPSNVADLTNYCSDDLGRTWTAYPPLTLTATCSNCGKGGGAVTIQATCANLALALDGSFLSLCEPPGTVTSGQALVANLYRQAPGATDWISLGPVPTAGQVIGAVYVAADPSASAGVLWYLDPVHDVLAVATLPS
jgi:hypothetical protein